MIDIIKIPSKWNRIFRKQVIRLLSDRNIIDNEFSDLENLHNQIDIKLFNYVVREKENELQHIFYETDDKFIFTYHGFLNELKNYLKFDFYFQSTPTIRFHAPKLKNEDKFPEFHSDIQYGHPPQEKNVYDCDFKSFLFDPAKEMSRILDFLTHFKNLSKSTRKNSKMITLFVISNIIFIN